MVTQITSSISRYHRTCCKTSNKTSGNIKSKSKSYPAGDTANCKDPANTCSKFAYQKANVTVPVMVKPFVQVGPANSFCCNTPTIDNFQFKPHGDKQICCFTISQEICVEIPVQFGAQVCSGEPWIDCHEVSLKPC
ncbi:MAG: hypothetical protein H6Q64_1052 [Firmicutes bacterium]|nr:hypothetical protein [Bacillota bacterium]